MKLYHTIDEKIHQICQIIAKVNRSLVPKQEDDSHTNLYFESTEKRIYGRWFQQNDKNYILALNLADFSFLLLADTKEIVKQFHIEGKTLIEIEEDIEKSFNTLQFSTEGLMKKLHFEISSYTFIDSIWEKPEIIELNTWVEYRSIANETCVLLLGIAQAKSEVRIWPHHFDTGIYFKAKKGLGIGFGLAMQDDMANDSYFYISAYPENYNIQYNNLPIKGNWKWEINENWKGAILPLKELDGKSYKEKINQLSDFITTTYNWIIKQ
ncbi:MAG: Unknown protein [uncultured Sulfurovum sp.]|uniref:Uncharacterized protein n=1 Tax=uncultured Sulfurovum sp. TaxID=269237 RepID=A0A6S6SSW2_9BACT|nr:MAG: Unknown protein [uncultured Sulfurovum sp.]